MEEFEDLTDISFDDFSQAIMYDLRNLSKSTSSKKPKNFDEISKNEFYKDIHRVGSKYNLIPGDLSRISSFKKIKDRVVLVDSGLSREIYDEFYEKNKSSSSKSSKKST